VIEEKRKLLERVRSYAKNVKEMYWPKISEEKRSEIQHLRKDSNTFQRLRSSVLLPPGGYHRNIQAMPTSARASEGAELEEPTIIQRQKRQLQSKVALLTKNEYSPGAPHIT